MPNLQAQRTGHSISLEYVVLILDIDTIHTQTMTEQFVILHFFILTAIVWKVFSQLSSYLEALPDLLAN